VGRHQRPTASDDCADQQLVRRRFEALGIEAGEDFSTSRGATSRMSRSPNPARTRPLRRAAGPIDVVRETIERLAAESWYQAVGLLRTAEPMPRRDLNTEEALRWCDGRGRQLR
jgi:hypothetical protein